MIGLVERILDVEHGRNGAACVLAVLDRHGAVVALGHHLQGQAVLRRQPHPHQAETNGAKNRRDDQRDARIDAAFADDAVIVHGLGGGRRGHPVSMCGAGNKKERDRVDPLFVIPTKNMNCR